MGLYVMADSRAICDTKLLLSDQKKKKDMFNIIWFLVIYSFWYIKKTICSVLWMGLYMDNVLSLSLISLYVEAMMI